MTTSTGLQCVSRQGFFLCRCLDGLARRNMDTGVGREFNISNRTFLKVTLFLYSLPLFVLFVIWHGIAFERVVFGGVLLVLPINISGIFMYLRCQRNPYQYNHLCLFPDMLS